MTRWRFAWLVALAATLLVLWCHSRSTLLLADSDTRVLLATIRSKNSPFSWFASDWPLYNHFYRPIPTLTFEIDTRLFGNWSPGYGWTNAIWAAGCVAALFWLLSEVLDSPFLAAGGACLFALWQTSYPDFFSALLTWGAWLVLGVGILRHRGHVASYLPAFFTILLVRELMQPLVPLGPRILDWAPGRTASTMTLFALIALAAYARFERYPAIRRRRREPTALDKPATKSSRQRVDPLVPQWAWLTLSLLATIGAFACYEQAVMLPACLLGMAVYFCLTHQKVHWWVHGLFWAILLGYLGLRHEIIPPGTSAYQAQQLKSSLNGPLDTLATFLFPPLGTVSNLKVLLEGGPYVLFDQVFYGILQSWVIFAVGAYQLRFRWRLALLGWLLPFLAFLPMAFLKTFEHYFFFPMALRTLLAIPTALVAFKLGANALCPPVLQAPPRPDPAPGSLPHR